MSANVWYPLNADVWYLLFVVVCFALLPTSVADADQPIRKMGEGDLWSF